MRKVISILLSLAFVLSMLSGVVLFNAYATNYETLDLIGVQDWSQAELDISSGNNGYANSCTCRMTVVTDEKYIVGNNNQAIKCEFGYSGTDKYNSCLVNWKYGVGGPCTDGSVWAPKSGNVVFSEYDGIRIAVLNSEGKTAHASKITFRVTDGRNYSSNMWAADVTGSDIVYDEEGYFYFPFELFSKNGTPPVASSVTDYLQNQATGISFLFYSPNSEKVTYYSDIQLYREVSGVSKRALLSAINAVKKISSEMFASQLETAMSVYNDDKATQEDVDKQVEILNKCIDDYNASLKFEYLQLDGVQNWTQADLDMSSGNNGYVNNVTASYTISDQQLVGSAKQSVKAIKSSDTASYNCLVNKKHDSNSIVGTSPWKVSKGYLKVSSFDGVMIAVRDENGKVPNLKNVRLRILTDPGTNGWGVFSECSHYSVTVDGYLKFAFEDFTNYEGLMAGIDVANGISFLLDDTGKTEYYYSDFKAYRAMRDINMTELESILEKLEKYNAESEYPNEISTAKALFTDPSVTQSKIDEMVNSLTLIYRSYAVTKVDFDESNIKFSFGAVSDLHMDEYGANSTNKYKTAVKLLKKYAGNKLDAITVAGDFTSNSYNEKVYQAFKQINQEELGDINSFFVTGNHDAQGADYTSVSNIFNLLSDYLSVDLPSSQHVRGNRHAIINGYHFIGVNMMDYWASDQARFDVQDLNWLATELAAARKDAPGKPIFVYMHACVYGTVWGSSLHTGTYWGSKDVYDYLKDYPEAVVFTGHIHYPLADQRCIHQKDFTTLNCGSVQYMAIDNGYLESGSKTTVDSSFSVSDGLLVQVDNNDNIRVTRIDFTNDKVLKDRFVIPAPDLENKTNLLYYNHDAFTLNNKAPEFKTNAELTAELAGSKMTVNFSAADDDDMVHHYNFKVRTLPSNTVTTVKAYCDFYLYGNKKDFPSSYSKSFPVNMGTDKDYELEVTAVDSFDLESAPLIYNSLTGMPIYQNTPGGNMINVDFITGQPRCAGGLNTVSVSATGGAGTLALGKAGYQFGQDVHVNISAPSSVATLTAKKFTAEVAFVPDKIGSIQYLFGCEKGEKGYAIFINKDGTISLSLNNDADGTVVINGKTPVTVGGLNVVQVSYASDVIKVYLNGKEDVAYTFTAKSKVLYGSGVPYVIGAKLNTGTVYSDFFTGVVFQVSVSSSGMTDAQIADRYQVYQNGLSYRFMKDLYEEYGYALDIQAMNTSSNDMKKVCSNYVAELSAAIKTLAVDSSYIKNVIRRDDFTRRVETLNGTYTIPEYSAPVISGVEDGAIYDLDKDVVVPVADDATFAEINFGSVNVGDRITVPGKYQMIALNHNKASVVEFEVQKTYSEPIVDGVSDGAVYDIYKNENPTITWDVGEATLNGESIESGVKIEAAGEYELVVTNGDKEVRIVFSVIDGTPLPIVSGIEPGKEYDLYIDQAPMATWDVGEATLNGEPYIAGTAITEPGDYTLIVVNGSKSVEITFTVVDNTPPYTKGDFDNDGEITVADALAALRIAAKLVDEDDASVAIGDIDGDEHVTVADALAILRVAAKLVEHL